MCSPHVPALIRSQPSAGGTILSKPVGRSAWDVSPEKRGQGSEPSGGTESQEGSAPAPQKTS